MGQVAKLVRVASGVALAVCAALTVPPAPAAAQDSDKLLAEVRAAWEKREKAAQNLTAKWNQEQFVPKGGFSHVKLPFEKKGEVAPPQDTKLAGHGRLTFAGANCRVSLDHPIWSRTYNKFNRVMSDAALKKGVLKTRTVIDGQTTQTGAVSKDSWGSWGAGSVWPLTTIYRGTTARGQEANLDIYSSARRIQSNIELTRERDETHGHAILLVDPVRDYLPTLSETFSRDGKLETRIAIRLNKDSRFGWVPESWDITSFDDGKLSRSVTCRLEQLILGDSIPDDVFELTYTHGTYLNDDTSGKSRDYIVRDGKEPREVLMGERGQPFDRLIATEAGDLLPGGRSSVLRKYWWAFAGAIIPLVILFVWQFRRARVRSQTRGA